MGNLYNTLHILITKNGMSDGSACAAVGLPRSTLGSLKTGKTKSLSQKNLKLFAELLHVSVDSLLKEDGDFPVIQSDLYERIHNLCEELDISDSEVCRAVQMSRSTLSNLKNGHARKLGAEKLNSFSSYFTHKLGRKITVEYLIGKEPESQINADIPKDIPLTMYDEAADTESSNNIKTTVVTYSRVAQDINDPVLRKIVNTCLESPEYIQPLSIMLDQLIKMSEVKNDTESKNS